MTHKEWTAILAWPGYGVYQYKLDSPEAERLTDLHAEIAKLQLGKLESLSWNNGLPLSGGLTFPPDFDPARKYPLLL